MLGYLLCRPNIEYIFFQTKKKNQNSKLKTDWTDPVLIFTCWTISSQFFLVFIPIPDFKGNQTESLVWPVGPTYSFRFLKPWIYPFYLLILFLFFVFCFYSLSLSLSLSLSHRGSDSDGRATIGFWFRWSSD